jgi:hypothetical protein
MVMALSAGLAGCEQPDWLTKRDPLPELPAWAGPLIGRPLTETFKLAPAPACLGNTEQVEARYGGARPGVRISGWGWDTAGKAPPARVLVVGPDGRIAGGGETGRERGDVMQARPEVTVAGTGWQALAKLTEGEAKAFGVLADGVLVCQLGMVGL